MNNNIPHICNEPRPVYCDELNLLGFNKYWKYKCQNDVPIMWAESNRYIYRNITIAKTTGGSIFEAPLLEPSDNLNDTSAAIGETLLPIDLKMMNQKNEEILRSLEQFTLKKIYEIYTKYSSKVDCFHVAFSGGKDSIVLLDLVKKAIPKNEFIVLFGDTGMEFPDTYDLVDKVESQCNDEGILFYRSKSHLDPSQSWLIFGPPATRLRWCCSVHKTAPQTLKLREITGKADYVGLDFVGIRSQESVKRSAYTYENYGKKQRGQYSHNSILEWSSAEIWLYIFIHGLNINNSYKKGNSRAGCLLCPNSGPKANYIRMASYPNGVKKYIDLLKEKVGDTDIDSYISNGGWIERRNGRDLNNNESKYEEEIVGEKLVIHVKNPTSDWMEWIKTISPISFEYSVVKTPDGIDAMMPAALDKTTSSKLFKQIFHKVAYCTGCRVCEANCPHGCISFDKKLHITGCKQCGLCNTIADGCILYNSIHQPKNGERYMKSLNSFSDHAPKQEWIQGFIDEQDCYFKENTILGPMQVSMFKRFLSDADLFVKGKTTEFDEIIGTIGWNTERAWALIYVNLVFNNPQMHWYVQNLPFDVSVSRDSLISILMSEGMSEKNSMSIVKAYKRIVETSLGTVLGIGNAVTDGKTVTALIRYRTSCTDGISILYGLYKYAELKNAYQFSLSQLITEDKYSDAISPAIIFGLTPESFKNVVSGLSTRYPNMITASFTFELNNISLNEKASSSDVLNLLR